MTYKECESMIKFMVKYYVITGPGRLSISPLKRLNLNPKIY